MDQREVQKLKADTLKFIRKRRRFAFTIPPLSSEKETQITILSKRKYKTITKEEKIGSEWKIILIQVQETTE